MTSELIHLFTEMGAVSAIFLTLGLGLCIVEIFVPGLGFYGLCGTGCLFIGVIFRCIDGMSFYQFMLLVLILAGVISFVIFCLVILVKMGILKDVGLFDTGEALPKDYDVKNHKKLIGKIAKTTTSLTLNGQAKICGKVYNAVSEDGNINKNKYVRIIRIETDRIVVKKLWE